MVTLCDGEGPAGATAVSAEPSGGGNMTDAGKSEAVAAGGMKKAGAGKLEAEEVVVVLVEFTGASVVQRAC